jgi:hypothetical protein
MPSEVRVVINPGEEERVTLCPFVKIYRVVCTLITCASLASAHLLTCAAGGS